MGDEHPEVERTSCCDETRNTIVSIPTAGFTRESECHWTRDHVFSLFFVAVEEIAVGKVVGVVVAVAAQGTPTTFRHEEIAVGIVGGVVVVVTVVIL